MVIHIFISIVNIFCQKIFQLKKYLLILCKQEYLLTHPYKKSR